MAADNVVLSAAAWLPRILWPLAVGSALVVLVTIGAYLVARYRYRREAPDTRSLPEACLYLNRERELIRRRLRQVGGTRTIQTRETTKASVGTNASTPIGGGRAERGREEETTTVSTVNIEAEDVIRDLVKELDRNSTIIHVDLNSGELRPGKALDLALKAAHGSTAGRPDSARVNDLRGYVSVRGKFEADRTTGTAATVTLSSLPGNAAAVRVDITCDSGKFLDEVPQDPFDACCFGEMKRDTGTGEWAIAPIAIFR